MTIKELMDAINAKKAEAKNLLKNDDIDGAKAAKAELDDLNNKLSIMQELEEEGEEKMRDAKPTTQIYDAVHEFADAARHGFRNTRTVTQNDETGNGGADGGYTVPQDILTRINHYKEARFSLENLVSKENVSTLSGRRVYQTRAQHTGFSSVAEAGTIGAKSGPQFTPVNYTVVKYAGYLPVTNELLADSDANITQVLTEWLAEEDIATRNAQIIAKIKTKTATAIEGIDDIKTALNVTLGQAFAGSSVIVTNDDGFNYLDLLKKESGSNEYLLKPMQDQTNPMKYTLAVGARVVPVVVVPNVIFGSRAGTGNDAGKTFIPFVIGDLKEYCRIFDRQQLSIATSTQAVVGSGENVINAFEQDMTLLRGITRFAAVVVDADAIVFGELEVGE